MGSLYEAYVLANHPFRETEQIRFGEQIWSGRDFFSLVEKIIAEMHQLRAVAGEKVILYGWNHPAQLASLLACSRLGLVFSIIYAGLNRAERDHITSRYSPDIRVAVETNGEVLVQRMASKSKKKPPPPKEFQAGGVLFSTSGTTSSGRLVFQNQESLMLNSRAAALHQRINRNSTTYSALTFSHTGGLNMQTLPAVLQGSRIIISPRFSPSHFLKTIAEASHTILVPAHWQLIRKSQAWVDAHFPTLSVVTGSSPVPRSLIEDIQGHGARVLSVYGLTEVGPFVCFSEDSVALPPGVESCLGQPVKGYSMDISESGEILIKGPCIGKSWEEESGQLVSLANENGWLETGDLGLEQEGQFFFCGRKNLFINVGGFKVSPSEVEAVIMEIPGVTRSALHPIPHPTWGEVPCAYIVGKNLTVEGVRRHLRKRLSSIKIPRKIELVSKVPETAIGKNNYRSMKSVKC